ncbi:AI-2E family transporter [Aphanothece hegewaldii CCALA 016]|uniref:AI-2E family transporter n=1 Tax=Aphanothece hegewaldii CCALA 016 TaxID=2107694 RepID=A0A2T1LU84_9CHRO|nr:AI-2E family transporter [Aphanothece hegewaldii]PSF35009.1 AI-2E family transporter [Aphanothece hegewaldii CCALA 016]
MQSDSKIIDLIVRLFLLGLLFFSGFSLLSPFLTVILWGAILSIACYPLFRLLKTVLKGRAKLTTVLLTLSGIAIIIGPVSAIGIVLGGNLRTLADYLATGAAAVPPPPTNLTDWPFIGERLSAIWTLASANIGEFLTRFEPQLKALGKFSFSLATDIGLLLFKFIVSIIIAGVFTLHAEGLIHGLNQLCEKIAPGRGPALAKLSASTVRNVSRGIIGIAILQSLLIGIGLIVAHIPAAGLLTLLCLLLTIIQIGPGLIVIGTLIFAWSTMNSSAALLLTLWLIPATLIDNFLKPILMARGLPVPMVVIIAGVFGGVIVYGIIGLFVGPVLLSLCYELVKAWINEDLVAKALPDDRSI